uniref:Portal protein n=1 Tax=viral metagenome TaxID=1070528 RepID=A0A6M3JSM3_9ZZZZ
MLEEAEDEIKWSDEIWNSSNIKALRGQQEEDFGNWGPKEYKMAQDEGTWDTMTTNAAKILGNKLIGILAYSKMQLFIDVDDEEKESNKAGRNKIADTERLANGVIWANDREIASVPSGKPIKSALSSFAILKGGIAQSLLWIEPKDAPPKCIIRTYDPMFCQWEEGDREILKFCFRNFVTEDFIKRTYKEKIKDGFDFGNPVIGKKDYLTYTFFDEDEWRTAINGKYVDEGEHGLGYCPVNIQTCGAVPYLHSMAYEDTMRFSWQSYAQNTRGVYDLMSKLLSIAKTKAVDSGRKDIIVEYDSNLDPNPPQIQKVGYGAGQRNNLVLIDKGKGQEYKGFLVAPGNEVIDSFYNLVEGMSTMGALDPIASGVMNRSGSGALAAELRDAALEFLNPYRGCVASGLVWDAEESVRQFKGGQYEKMEVEGRDTKGKKFLVKLEPADVAEKHFDCNLITDSLRDRTIELGDAINEVKNGLSSPKSAMRNHNLHPDPDKEMELIEQHKHVMMSAEDPVYHNASMAAFYVDKIGSEDVVVGITNEEMAEYHSTLAKLAVKGTIEGMMGAANQAGGKRGTETPPGTPVSPQATSAAIGSEALNF